MLQIGAPVINIWQSYSFVLCMWSSVGLILGLFYFDSSHELVWLFPRHFHPLIALEYILMDNSRACRLCMVFVTCSLTILEIFFFNQAQIVEF